MSQKKEKCYLGFTTYYEKIYVEAQLREMRKEFGTSEFNLFRDKFNLRHIELKEKDPQYKRSDDIYLRAIFRNFKPIEEPKNKSDREINAMIREVKRIHFATRPLDMSDKDKAKAQVEIRKEYEKALNDKAPADDLNLLILKNKKKVWTI